MIIDEVNVILDGSNENYTLSMKSVSSMCKLLQHEKECSVRMTCNERPFKRP